MNKTRNIPGLLLAILLIASLLVVCFDGVAALDYPGVFTEEGVSLSVDLVGGSTITYEAQIEGNLSSSVIEEGLTSAVAMIRQRLDWMELTEATVRRGDGNRIVVEIPAITDPDEAVEKLGQMGEITFVDSNKNTVLSGSDIKSAVAQYGDLNGSGQYTNFVALQLNEGGVTKIKEATGAMASLIGSYDSDGKPMNRIDIMLDGEIISSPVVEQVIDTSPVITTGEDAEEASWLANIINAGDMPFVLKDIESRTVGASLGQGALKGSLIAGGIGLLLVCVFMIVMYKLPGVLSVIALIGYMSVYCFLISFLRINLSLEGIAGAILSIGMAVDANVVIFERIKEELRAGKTVSTSINSGFKGAMTAVIDSNITTLIAAVVLWVLGSGSVQGFAKTLFLGVALSMISAVLFTKFLLVSTSGFKFSTPKNYGVKLPVAEIENSEVK